MRKSIKNSINVCVLAVGKKVRAVYHGILPLIMGQENVMEQFNSWICKQSLPVQLHGWHVCLYGLFYISFFEWHVPVLVPEFLSQTLFLSFFFLGDICF